MLSQVQHPVRSVLVPESGVEKSMCLSALVVNHWSNENIRKNWEAYLFQL